MLRKIWLPLLLWCCAPSFLLAQMGRTGFFTPGSVWHKAMETRENFLLFAPVDVQLTLNNNFAKLDHQLIPAKTFINKLENGTATTDDWDYLDLKKKRFAYTDVQVHAPYLYGQWKKLGVEVGLSHRTIFSTKDFPDELAYNTYTAIPFGQEVQTGPVQGAVLGWREWVIGLYYRLQTDDQLLILGGRFKQLQGYEGAYFSAPQGLLITPLNVDAARVDLPDMELGYSSSIIEEGEFNTSPNGTGQAIELQAFWQNNGYNGNRFAVEARLRDLGTISFEENSWRGRANAAEPVTYDEVLLDDFDEAEDIPDILAATLALSGNVPDSAATIAIGLPARLQLAVHQTWNDHWTASAWYEQGLFSNPDYLPVLTRFGLRGGYQWNWGGAYADWTAYAGYQSHLGLALRLGPLTIGTQQIGTFFKKENIRGANLYLQTEFLLWSGNGGGGRGRGRGMKCYDF